EIEGLVAPYGQRAAGPEPPSSNSSCTFLRRFTSRSRGRLGWTWPRRRSTGGSTSTRVADEAPGIPCHAVPLWAHGAVPAPSPHAARAASPRHGDGRRGDAALQHLRRLPTARAARAGGGRQA